MSLKEQIRDRGIKISWIAQKVGVSQPLLSMYLNGDRSFPDEIKKQIKQLLS